VKQGLGLIVYISMFPNAYKLKNKFQLEEESIGILDPAAVQDCKKIPNLITNVLLQLVGDIIKGVR